MNTTLAEYLTALSSAEPTPGGGSAAALVGALAASLLAMTARLALRSKRFKQPTAESAALVAAGESIVKQADTLRDAFQAARTADEAAYADVRQAFAAPKATATEQTLRQAAIALALEHAAEAPLEIARLAAQTAKLAQATLALGHMPLLSDIICAAEFAQASANAAAANVRINHQAMHDTALITQQATQLQAYLAKTAEVRALICDRI